MAKTKEEREASHAARKAAWKASAAFSAKENVVPTSYSSLSNKNPEYEIADFLFEENIFENILGSIYYNREVVYTNFTDEQAVVICSKMADSYARSMASKYKLLPNHIHGSIIRFQLHLFANKALNLYGGPLLTFLYNLRPLRFRNIVATKVKYVHSNEIAAQNSIYFPVLTFKTTKSSEFTLAFHLNKKTPKRRNKNPVHIFRNGKNIGSISKQGNSYDTLGNRLKSMYSVKPTLLIFCEYLKMSRNPAFFSGVETGNCFVCGRILTDPESIRYGIGPICLGKVE